MKLTIVATRAHSRGRIYQVKTNGRAVSVLFTFHALGRLRRWALTEKQVLQALLFPQEVLRGHRGRFIAHRRKGRHIVRAVYEYEEDLPVVITVYYPYASRYFKGGGVYEDKILS